MSSSKKLKEKLETFKKNSDFSCSILCNYVSLFEYFNKKWDFNFFCVFFSEMNFIHLQDTTLTITKMIWDPMDHTITTTLKNIQVN